MVQDSNGLGHAPVYESSEMEPYVWVSSEVEGLLWYVRYKTLGGFSGREKKEERCSRRREDGAGIACNFWLRRSWTSNRRSQGGRRSSWSWGRRRRVKRPRKTAMCLRVCFFDTLQSTRLSGRLRVHHVGWVWSSPTSSWHSLLGGMKQCQVSFRCCGCKATLLLLFV